MGKEVKESTQCYSEQMIEWELELWSGLRSDLQICAAQMKLEWNLKGFFSLVLYFAHLVVI